MTQPQPSLLQLPPFPDIWKYGMLALSILLLLVAFIILMCQLYRCRKDSKFGEGMFQRTLWIKKIQKELKKLGICFSPLANSHSMDNLCSGMDAPDRSQGRLRFSLLYNKERLELLLTVTEALGLPSQGCTNTFVKVRLLSWSSSQSPHLQHIVHEWQTRVAKHSRSPAFGDQFACTLPEADLTKSSIKLQVKHFDRYSRHMPLGEVRIVLNALNTSEKTEFCEELQKATKDTVGEVLVSLKCLPISQRIEVGLLKVKTAFLHNSPEKRIYARIDVFSHLHNQKHQKSKAKTLASTTIFNETFLFYLPEPVAWDCAVLISIYELHPSSKQLVGQAVLGKRGPNNMNDHWHHMMQSIQQPVAKWHPLLI
ncbi:LOW QUALITY PROTEIN: synaptotagmin-1-like [Rhineura floridana]|uniref:LOW QUALITY PROTEIN: synaptotagmin-1-like n=1 Tax=Rhineura floridana TaxID=261503 RepID=UPI002AC868F8|nr:LOW QUALITY PROTEIN: synaptotagmin-1-like [Rhineura floridana]